MDRRNFMAAAATGTTLAVAGGFGPAAAQSTGAGISLRGPYLDLLTGKGNMIAKARMDGNLDESKEKFATGTGTVSAVCPGEAVRDLFGFEIYSAGRIRKQPDGTFLFLHRECIYYTDLVTGDILTEYLNPYTNERVKVVDVANDPWNEKIKDVREMRPSYGGLIKRDEAPPTPYLLDWKMGPRGIVIGSTHANLYYPATLKPDKWPRESAGTMNQVSEFYQYFVSLEELQNEKLTSVEYNGSWVRITPWLPWMLMGQKPGNIFYQCSVAYFDDINRVNPKVIAHTIKYHPQMMHAPTEWSEPSLSSLEDYARTQKPAPVK